MPSIDSQELAMSIIETDGYYEDDPRVIQVAKYKNDSGGTTYHIAYSLDEVFSLLTSPYCHEIEILWVAK